MLLLSFIATSSLIRRRARKRRYAKSLAASGEDSRFVYGAPMPGFGRTSMPHAGAAVAAIKDTMLGPARRAAYVISRDALGAFTSKER